MGLFTTVTPTINDANVVLGLAEDMDDWTCEDWKTYYTRIHHNYNEAKAVETVNTDVDRIGSFADWQNCRYNCDWVTWMKAKGVNTGSNVFSNSWCAAENVTEVVASTTSSTAFKLLPPVLIGLVVWQFMKK